MRGPQHITVSPTATAVTRRRGILGALALNAVALGALWLVYSSVRSLTANSWGVARSNAGRLIDFQESIGLPSEAVLQRVFLDYEWLVRGANVYYVGIHFPSMVLLLGWVLLAKRAAMPRVRLALVGATVAGLLIQLVFPLAPPRMLRFLGFVDTAQLLGPDPYALGIAKAANKLAAMPSMHVGWALLLALAVVHLSNHRLRWLAFAHPLMTSFVVIVTANHYWTDVIVGAALGGVAWFIAGALRPEPGAEVLLGLVELSAEDHEDAEPDRLVDVN